MSVNISLVSAPEAYMPAYNPIEWKFSCTDVSSCDFLYICDLYINGDFAVRLKASPDLNDQGVFRLERILQDYLSFHYQPTQTGFNPNDNSIVQYHLELRAKYNDSTNCTGDATLTGVLYTTDNSPASGYFAWNGALQYKQYPEYEVETYLATTAQSKFLSAFPRKTLIGVTDYFSLSFLQYYSAALTQVDSMQIKTYGVDGALLSTTSVSNPYTTPDTDEIHLHFGAGPQNLNDYGELQSPPVTIIGDTVKYYTLQLLDASSNGLSEIKEFEIDSYCTKHRKFRLWWLNRLGGFDSYNFHLKSVRSLDVSRSTFSNALPTNYTEGDRGDSVASVSARSTYKLNSNWLTEAEALWIEDLFTSPEVYLRESSSLVQEATIVGAAHLGGFANLILGDDLVLATGTTFTYEVDDGSPIGMADSGSGVITGYVGGQHTTNVVSTINAGALIEGTMTATTDLGETIPVIVETSSYEEKRKANMKNINYTIEVRSSFKVNVQSL